VVARGFLDRPDYEALVDRADVVVSAAKGENFGIAVVEAIAAGAWPVLPDALAYPEIIPVSHHNDCLYGEGDLGKRLAEVIAHRAAGASAPGGLAEAMAVHAWPVTAERMDHRLDELLRR
jgi:glycosyltransferase involved in cell wall biosynthesis